MVRCPNARGLCHGWRHLRSEAFITESSFLSGSPFTILIVDGEPDSLARLSDMLTPHYPVVATHCAAAALRTALLEPRPRLVLIDGAMPDGQAYDLLAQLRADPATRDIPVVFVADSAEAEQRAFEAGVVDCMVKPLSATVVQARLRAQATLHQARQVLHQHEIWLEKQVARRQAEDEAIQASSIRALAYVAENRDAKTGNHLLRIQGYIGELARHLAHRPQYDHLLTPRYIDLMVRSAPLYDIGKVGIPDAILQKPGRLTPEEWEIIKTHAVLGAKAIERAERDAHCAAEFLCLAKEIARWHHEKWDGSGYPDGLVGDAIPLSARLMAISDVFDAMISTRAYKPAMAYEKARGVIAARRGRHFDPDVADAFESSFERLVSIAERYQDEPEHAMRLGFPATDRFGGTRPDHLAI
jgi:putative two-component system response regulator